MSASNTVMAEQWGGLQPEQVSKWINFDASDPDWRHIRGAPPSMASLQAEGVAHLWNLLSKHHVALLADEVGMGKTFQALGVAAMLWKMKPSATVLVMAPNRDICAHWKREFAAFTRFHYRHADGRVKSLKDGQPVPPIDSQFRLRELAEAVECRLTKVPPPPPQLYITTIHSLSGLVDGTDQRQDKLAVAKRVAHDLNRRIIRALDSRGFDLVIIDEAHYFRNPNGASQRAAAAKAFFGAPSGRIGQRTLLLTATPSHTHLDDVANILGYFVEMNEATRDLPAEKLMATYALRRFRIMSGNGASYTKHRYRREIATPCDFAGHPDAEMFFALYQRRLVRELGILDERRRVLYGFLEGFESAGEDSQSSVAEMDDEDQPHDERSRDFRAADDTVLLHDMSKNYRDIFGRAPDHPKYGPLVAQCAPPGLFPMPANRPLHEDKHLIFVRRIPSVRELTKRINEQYDQLLAQEICEAWGLDDKDTSVDRWRRHQWSRDGFNALVQIVGSADIDAEDEGTDESASEEPEEVDSYLGSKIADLFVTKKAKTGKPAPPATDCSRFSLSLRKSNSIHAMFMEPASDFMAAGYSWYYEYKPVDKIRSDYTKAAQMQRMCAHSVFPMESVSALPPLDASKREYNVPVDTLWSLVFPHLDASLQQTLRRWATERPDIAENFSNYIKAGFLFASPVIIELYGWHTRCQRLSSSEPHTHVQQRYLDFVAYARQRISDSLLLRYFAAALGSFEQLCGKIIDHKVGDWVKGWRTLTTLSSPAWYASGESSHRQHLILGFNSPFYPNTLVATSVFQEGVNLHMQCRKVHHYGIAWTPGDNEQRVGRVDRLFGKVHGLLEQRSHELATLDINYPYLKDSFDEDQVGSFIERKHAVEEKWIAVRHGSFDKEIRMTRPGWQEFLRQPMAESTLEDPYPARFGEEDVPRQPYPGES